ncbi:MAG: J domain-containing protein [Flavobacteriales bacterium]
MKNYYQILGLHPDASEEEIRSAFRSKAKELHPDVNPSPAAHEQFLECQQAYAFLTDAAQRQNYDTLLRNEKITEADMRRRELVYKLWVEHQQRKARTRTAMEAVRYDAQGNPLRRKIWKGVNLAYNVLFMFLFLSVVIVPLYNYSKDLERPENMQRSPIFFITPMIVGIIFLVFGYYYWFVVKTDNDQ